MNFRFNYDALLVCGKSGAGKTTNLIKPLIASVPRSKVFVVDSNFEFPNLPPENRIRPLDYSAKWLDSFISDFRRKHIDCLLIIEDLDMFDPLQSKELKKLCVNGRHQNIGLIVVSRRILGIPKVVVMKMRYIAIFRGLSPEDRDYLEEINPDFGKLQFPVQDFKYVIVENP